MIILFRGWAMVAMFIFSGCQSARAVDFEAINRQLVGNGIKGWIHGAVDKVDEFVFTYRAAGNFFDSAQFPLLAKNANVRSQLKELQRHDEVLVRGRFLQNGAPIRHILIEEITLIKKYQPSEQAGPYQYETELPEDLMGKTVLVAAVHAV